jgi:hypothetical protein
VPVKVKLKLKDVTLELIEDETASVSVALTDSPAARLYPSLFQFIVIGPSATEGFQPEVVMLKVTGTVPVFLT